MDFHWLATSNPDVKVEAARIPFAFFAGLLVALSLSSCAVEEEAPPCQGTAWSCGMITNPARCPLHQGCEQGEACLTDPAGCASWESESLCAQMEGCVWVQRCSGYTSYCYDLWSASECNEITGCTWVNSVRECWGTPVQCTYLSPVDCSSQSGCKSSGLCEADGSCAEFSQPVCDESSAGCYWGVGCAGKAVRCEDLSLESSCEAQAGCYWTPGAW